MFVILLFLGFLVSNVDLFFFSLRNIELEQLLNGDKVGYTIWRSRASEGKSVRLDSLDSSCRFEFKLCAKPSYRKSHVKMVIRDIRFSNDGPSDTVQFFINGRNFGNASTIANAEHGYGWNKFYASGKVGRTQYLSRGEYNLTVRALPDRSGVELDRLDLSTIGQDSRFEFICKKKFVCDSNQD